MPDIFFLPVILIMIVCFVLVPVIAKIKSEMDGSKTVSKKTDSGKPRDYHREVDAIHITTDAASERQRRLDQLKSLYECGMMERYEYQERCASVEADYNRGYHR